MSDFRWQASIIAALVVTVLLVAVVGQLIENIVR